MNFMSLIVVKLECILLTLSFQVSKIHPFNLLPFRKRVYALRPTCLQRNGKVSEKLEFKCPQALNRAERDATNIQASIIVYNI